MSDLLTIETAKAYAASLISESPELSLGDARLDTVDGDLPVILVDILRDGQPWSRADVWLEHGRLYGEW